MTKAGRRHSARQRHSLSRRRQAGDAQAPPRPNYKVVSKKERQGMTQECGTKRFGEARFPSGLSRRVFLQTGAMAITATGLAGAGGDSRGDEHRRIVQRAARPHARCHGQPCRARRGARACHAHQPARPGACRCDRHDGPRRRQSDAARHNLPHRLEDQADHGRSRDDPGGGMQAAARRPGGPVASRAGRSQGLEAARRAARRHRAGGPPDHRATF